jgi:hypothetical protein
VAERVTERLQAIEPLAVPHRQASVVYDAVLDAAVLAFSQAREHEPQLATAPVMVQELPHQVLRFRPARPTKKRFGLRSPGQQMRRRSVKIRV